MSQPRDDYLQTQILTSSPQRLRLMLIEHALREVDQTDRFWGDRQPEQALEAIIRCRDIISELIGGIRPDESSLAKKVLGLYLFLFQALSEAQLSHDRQKLGIVRRILTSERETWQQVCQQLASVSATAAACSEPASSAPLALEA